MKTIAYIRVSTEKQDHDSQRLAVLEYANQQGIQVDEFIAVEITSRKNREARRIDELIADLSAGDIVIVTELSRLGRNMLETLNIISDIDKSGAVLHFVKQPELSTVGPMRDLLLGIFAYFAQAERDFISMRTKMGLAKAKANGAHIGRPKGAGNREHRLDEHAQQIQSYVAKGLPVASIKILIDEKLGKGNAVPYNTYRNFIKDRLPTLPAAA